jgi:endonuclease/exonuclease/phosphatase family metal-dependent hydrolase
VILDERPAPGYSILPDGSVRFALYRPDACSVRLAGTFTGWSARMLPMRRTSDGMWEVRTSPLPVGVHFYKYVVDNGWVCDPAHPMGEPDGYGGRNSGFGIDAKGLQLPPGLRVASLNLHTYQETEPLFKLEQVAYGLARLGVHAVALQEVGEHLRDPSRGNAGELLREHLKRLTGGTWYHAWRMAHVGFHVYREGVSLLATVPLEDIQEYRLSQGMFARNALAAAIRVRDCVLRLVSTHVSWPAHGGLDDVNCLLQATSFPGVAGTLIAGDFNADNGSAQVKRMAEAGFQDAAVLAGADGPTVSWAGGKPAAVGDPDADLVSRIDYQFFRPATARTSLRVLGCCRIFNRNIIDGLYLPRVSDHVGLLGLYGTGEDREIV